MTATNEWPMRTLRFSLSAHDPINFEAAVNIILSEMLLKLFFVGNCTQTLTAVNEGPTRPKSTTFDAALQLPTRRMPKPINRVGTKEHESESISNVGLFAVSMRQRSMRAKVKDTVIGFDDQCDCDDQDSYRTLTRMEEL